MTSHQKSELKAAFNEFNKALLRPKDPDFRISKNRRRTHNRRIRKIKHKIELLSKVLGITEFNQRQDNGGGFNLDAPNPDAFIPNVVDPNAINPDAGNLDAVNPDVVNPDADNLVVVKLEC